MKKKNRSRAVALSYMFDHPAPVITAGGCGAVAERIKEIAESCHIPLVTDPFLAEILVEADIGSCIPEETYQAVAAVFAFIKKRDEVFCAETN